MNPLQRTLIEKTGNDNGFEHVVASDASCVTLASARHANRALVGLDNGAYHVRFETGSQSLMPELQRSFPAAQVAKAFRVATEADWQHCCAGRPAFLVHYPVRPRTITNRLLPRSFQGFPLA